MQFYSTCILIPLVFGVLMYFVREDDATVDTDPYLPLFSVFMAIWAVLFLVVSQIIFSGVCDGYSRLQYLCLTSKRKVFSCSYKPK